MNNSSSAAEGCATNTSNNNNQGLNLYDTPDLTTELGFIDGNAEQDLNVSGDFLETYFGDSINNFGSS